MNSQEPVTTLHYKQVIKLATLLIYHLIKKAFEWSSCRMYIPYIVINRKVSETIVSALNALSEDKSIQSTE